MSIELLTLTPKGWAFSHSVRQSATPEWRVINYLAKMGGRAARDRLEQFVFNGNIGLASVTVRNLKYKGIVTGE